ncbi:uncharacterized protein LOC129871059 [Solanum dulcamara]|uniref:uncharacterized protein LOC129871059 n=1 Tax=Solanum dulcamara TaxID=45834 RepID=UPI0024867B6C|nr:uncharacterized protein LOC129871059 [Solanum dulcamara]XP_055801900.1 uncharacterized protein LOC129871059 [Solanum dulcamara]
MARAASGGREPPENFPPLPTQINHATPPPSTDPNLTQYATILKPKIINPAVPNVPPKPVVILHGEPSITWKSSEIKLLIVKENLQYAIIGKFSYGKPDVQELRKTIPGQCGIKSECTIGVLDARHILIRLTTMEDYVNLLSTPAFYVKAKENYWQMRTLKWDPWFESEVETTIGVAWISFPDLPPNFFAREAIFSIARAIEKPLTVDMATKNQTRPSCAKVKIEVDLTAKLPQRVKINEEDDNTGEVKYKWIKIQYDNMPKYCKECCLQGHDDKTCWTLHPQLYDTMIEENRNLERKGETQNVIGTETNSRKILTSGKVVGNKHNKQEWMVRRRNKYKKDKYGHIEGEIDYQDKNSFDALRDKEEHEDQGKEEDRIEENKNGSTKEWVNKTFNKKEVKEAVNDKEQEGNNKEGIVTHQKKDNCEEGNSRQESMQIVNIEESKAVEENKEEEEINKGTIVVYELNNEPCPLAIENATSKESKKGTYIDKDDISQNIERINAEGDLSPKHKGRLKEMYTKQKKQSEADIKQAQASSRQSKRTIVKNPRYQ